MLRCIQLKPIPARESRVLYRVSQVTGRSWEKEGERAWCCSVLSDHDVLFNSNVAAIGDQCVGHGWKKLSLNWGSTDSRNFHKWYSEGSWNRFREAMQEISYWQLQHTKSDSRGSRTTCANQTDLRVENGDGGCRCLGCWNSSLAESLALLVFYFRCDGKLWTQSFRFITFGKQYPPRTVKPEIRYQASVFFSFELDNLLS